MNTGSRFYSLLFAVAIILMFIVPAFADTITMKDGSIIKGKVVDFKDNQFTVVIGDDSKGRKRQITIYADEVVSITFDSAAAGGTVAQVTPTPVPTPVATPTPNVIRTLPTPNPTPVPTPAQTPRTNPTPNRSGGKPNYIRVSDDVKVLADNTANGWTNSGFVVRRGQHVRVTARGNISLGNGKFARPDGDQSLADKDKLMQQKPTGGLIAVIGDDNDEFIFIGSSVEFIAQRDGTLFLGINEGNLDDNSGAFDVTVEAEMDNPDSPE
jgi:hypothetical protein